MRRLAKCLDENKVVSISALASGQRTCITPFLAAQLRLATGPVNLAIRTNARLLPVFTLKKEDGSFDVIIEPPLKLEGQSPQIYQAAVEQFASYMRPQFLSNTDQWYSALYGVSQRILENNVEKI